MQQNPSPEFRQEALRVWWYPKVHFRGHRVRHLSHLRIILVLSSNLHLGLLSPSGFRTNNMCHVSHAPSITSFLKWSPEYLVRSKNHWTPHNNSIHPRVTSYLFGPNFFVSSLSSNVFSVRSSLIQIHPLKHLRID